MKMLRPHSRAFLLLTHTHAHKKGTTDANAAPISSSTGRTPVASSTVFCVKQGYLWKRSFNTVRNKDWRRRFFFIRVRVYKCMVCIYVCVCVFRT